MFSEGPNDGNRIKSIWSRRRRAWKCTWRRLRTLLATGTNSRNIEDAENEKPFEMLHKVSNRRELLISQRRLVAAGRQSGACSAYIGPSRAISFLKEKKNTSRFILGSSINWMNVWSVSSQHWSVERIEY